MVECLTSAATYVVAGMVATFCVPPTEPVPTGYVWELVITQGGDTRTEHVATPYNYMGFAGKVGEEVGVCVREQHGDVVTACAEVGQVRVAPNYDTDGDGCVGATDFRDYRRVFGQCVGEDGGYHPKSKP